jgi:hypothetical protein
MKTINQCCNTYSLDEEIMLLQVKKEQAFKELKDEFKFSLEKTTSNAFSDNIFYKILANIDCRNESIAIAAGYIAQELVIKKSSSVITKFIGNTVKEFVTAITEKTLASFKTN